jgi:hypothetical protein
MNWYEIKTFRQESPQTCLYCTPAHSAADALTCFAISENNGRPTQFQVMGIRCIETPIDDCFNVPCTVAFWRWGIGG